ncbi:MAG: sigma 54-interacting transcriptional regulator [Pirellulales bacterium]
MGRRASETSAEGSATRERDTLRTLLEISGKLHGERDVGSLLARIASEAARLLDAELASLFLLDETKRVLWSRVSLDANQELRFAADQGIAGETLRTGQVICVQDASHDPRFFPGVDAATGFRTRNLLALPVLNLRGERVGVFEVLNKRHGTFDDEDVETARLLTTQAALALEAARYVEELRHEQQRLEAANERLARAARDRFTTHGLLGASPAIRDVVRLIEQVADTTATVLIQGESGTGKELAARAIHYGSPRASGLFVALNCAALPEALVESELFGMEKGVATGVEARAGKFELAHGGTLFLDELGELSLVTQAKLLRVLQERVVERVGGRQAIPIDVRVVAATNRDLASAMRAGTFREDLYYRLNVVRIRMPPLREMASDIGLLANAFLDEHCRAQQRPRPSLSAEAVRCLESYAWPGNARELYHEMLRLAVSVRREVIEASDLAEPGRAARSDVTAPSGTRSLREAVEELERQWIRAALAATGQNHVRAARELGLSRQGLIKKIKRFGLE